MMALGHNSYVGAGGDRFDGGVLSIHNHKDSTG